MWATVFLALSIIAAVPESTRAEVCGYVLTKDCTHIFDMTNVCGTDGTTYRNQCLLAKAYCNDNTVQKAHDGPCGGTTTTTMRTTVDGSQIALDIFCLDISYINCQSSGTPVCGDNGVRYVNRCEFDKERCFHRTLQEVTCS